MCPASLDATLPRCGYTLFTLVTLPRCGYTDLIPKLWVEKINAVIPGVGFHVRWHGLWMEVAEGVSMENFLHKGTGRGHGGGGGSGFETRQLGVS